jgi:pimeloyl-ACP methyl ester carboxylesterase
MRVLLLLILIYFSNSKVFASPARFITVGISGVATARLVDEDLEDSRIAPWAQDSSVWRELPTHKDHPEIIRSFYITHFESAENMEKILSLFDDGRGSCHSDLGLILEGNSWGATNTRRMAENFKNLCGREADLVILIDGVALPIPTAFTREILAQKCINYFETESTISGNALPNCENRQMVEKNDILIYEAHWRIEWDAADRALKDVSEFLKSLKLDPQPH